MSKVPTLHREYLQMGGMVFTMERWAFSEPSVRQTIPIKITAAVRPPIWQVMRAENGNLELIFLIRYLAHLA